MNQIFNVKTYTEDFARRNKRVLHKEDNERFFSANNLGDLDGFINNLYNNQPPYVVAISASDEDNLSEYFSRQFYTVLILDKDEASAKAVARSFKSKLLKDKESGVTGLTGLDITSIRSSSFGPLNDLNGIMVTFFISDGNGLEYDEEEWIE